MARETSSTPRSTQHGVPLGQEPSRVLAMLTDPVDSEAELVSLSRELDSLRQEALHV